MIATANDRLLHKVVLPQQRVAGGGISDLAGARNLDAKF